MESQSIEYILYRDYFPEKENPHVIVYSTPYDFYYNNLFPKCAPYTLQRLHIRTVYIPYGIEYDSDADVDDYGGMIKNQNFLAGIQTGQNVHFYAWRLYVMHEDIKRYYKDKSLVNLDHIKVLGAPKFDIYCDKNNECLVDNNLKMLAKGRKIVAYQIHIPNNNNVREIDKLKGRYHTLNFDIHRKILSLIKKREEYFFVITIHPLFETTAINRFKLVSNAVFNSFLQEIYESENCFLFRSGNYQTLLLTADAFITENSSLMIEMSYWDKPVLYLYDVPVKMKPFAEKIISTF